MNQWQKLRLDIWNNRDHICDLCLLPIEGEPLTYYFSHIVSKGAEIRAKYDPDNIMLNHFECHQKWEFSDASRLPGYEDIKAKKEEIKEKYNRL